MTWYILAYSTLCLAAIVLAFRNRRALAIIHGTYWRFLGEPWKVLTGITATVGLTVMAPYTGDPTWDYVDALFMSLLTCATAPWVVGVIFRGVRRKECFQNLFIAVCCWLFSASWSYDLYILWRDGYYPMTWDSNLAASSFLYLMAGTLWNLEWRKGHGLSFAFMHDDWPTPVAATPFGKIAWLAVPLMLLVAILMGRFLLP